MKHYTRGEAWDVDVLPSRLEAYPVCRYGLAHWGRDVRVVGALGAATSVTPTIAGPSAAQSHTKHSHECHDMK